MADATNKRRKLAVLSIGQTPRSDDIVDILRKYYDVSEYGCLDTYTLDEANKKFGPTPEDVVLRPRMRSGPPARVAAKYIDQMLQGVIPQAEADGCEVLLPFCLGAFPDFAHRALFVKPYDVCHGILSALGKGFCVGIVVPDKQMENSLGQEFPDLKFKSFTASPFFDDESMRKDFENFDHEGVDFFFLNCASFNETDREILKEVTGKPVILSRAIIELVCKELS